jgi:outer membrane PBP1 activator LpoA protein
MNIELLQLQATAEAQSNAIVPSLLTSLRISSLLSEPYAIEQNQNMIWHTLRLIPTNELQNLANNPILQGWAALALITRQYSGANVQLFQHIRFWQTQYPEHPANAILAKNINSLASKAPEVKQVALLLPLQGPLAQQAQAVLNGFLAAHYRAKAMNLPTATLKVYDTTTTENIVQQYQDAVSDGADFVVGPLTKGNVQLLKTKGDISVPTLALNYSTDNTPSPNDFYQFALSPESEAKDAAVQAIQLGHVNALSITPIGQWGANIADAFNTEWEALNGQVVNSLAFPANRGLKDVISELLNVNQSNWRKIKLQKALGQKVKFSARRRKDFDMIFLNALPAQALEIVPLLRFYYAGNVPIYATSQVYSGLPNAQRDKDLDGVQFTIMPWAINPSIEGQKLRQQFNRNWPRSFKKYNLLYAFGADSYQLISGINQIKAFPTLGLLGNTGRLFLTSTGRIRRQLEWVQFEKGLPKLMAKQKDVIGPLQS